MSATEIRAMVVQEWIAACAAFAACCRACGEPLDCETTQRIDVELALIVADREHVGRTDLEVLVLAHSRVRPRRVAQAVAAAAAVLARAKGGPR